MVSPKKTWTISFRKTDHLIPTQEILAILEPWGVHFNGGHGGHPNHAGQHLAPDHSLGLRRWLVATEWMVLMAG